MSHASKVVASENGRNTRPHPWAKLGVAGAMTLMAGCGASPTSPSTPARPVAVVEISTFELRLSGAAAGSYFYEPTIVLTEKSGKSGAKLTQLAFIFPGGSIQLYSPELCEPAPSGTIQPGARWESRFVARSCLDVTSASGPGDWPLRLLVLFTDDNGVAGQVSASTVAGAAP